jgi:hypothetical protein
MAFCVQALDQEAIIKCRQLGVYEPPGLAAGDAGARANLRRALWRWRCVGQVRHRSMRPCADYSSSLSSAAA